MNWSNDVADDSNSTAIFLLTYLFLSIKLWRKPYFNGFVSKSSLDRLITGTVYESFFLLLLFLFGINWCSFLFFFLLLCNVSSMFLLMLLYSKEPTCWNIAFDKCLWQFSKYCKFFLWFNKWLFKTPSSAFIWSLDSVNLPFTFGKVGTTLLCNDLV